MSEPGRVVDAHVYPIDIDGGPQLSAVAAVAEFLTAERLDDVVLVSRDLELLRTHVAASPRVHGMLWVDPRRSADLESAELALDERSVVGLKLHPGLDGIHPDDPATHAVYDLASRYGVPVAIHCGTPSGSPFTLPWAIERAVVRYPTVRFVLAHMGYCVFEFHEAAMQLAERRENVWLDISGMPHNWRVREAVDRVGAERVIYGSAAPWHHPRLEREKVRRSDLTPEEARRILGENAAELFLESPTREADR
ncbi:MAG TPA: amidohydrolase family protein [Pseudolysinimonas sp.]|nr:amidohydrolase family protein [Pseudolysinimonas sp.]